MGKWFNYNKYILNEIKFRKKSWKKSDKSRNYETKNKDKKTPIVREDEEDT